MTTPHDRSPQPTAHPGASADGDQRAAYWPIPLARAVPAVVLALAITFTGGHSPQYGLVAFGAYAIVSGLIISLTARRLALSGARPYLLAQGIVTLVLGVAAVALQGTGIPGMFLVLTVWAALTGALELYSGLRTRRRFTASVDWITVGSLTLITAIVLLFIPPDYADQFVDGEGLAGVIDAGVLGVGLFGAYAAIIAVYLVVAGFSAKWGTGADASATAIRPPGSANPASETAPAAETAPGADIMPDSETTPGADGAASPTSASPAARDEPS